MDSSSSPRAFTDDRLTKPAGAALATELGRFPDTQRFAVRSSALAEDSAAASFAGAYESVLDVPRDGVEQAIATVRASRHAERVGAYSKATGAVSGDVAVVVQAMVAADLAGVLFTVHPLTGDLSTMMGTVVHGLGESLVSGEQTGEQFTLARPSGELTGPAALEPHAKELHLAAHRLEGSFDGVPQDVEWAVADGKVWILQARPITTLDPWNPRTAERNDSRAGACLWSATNLSEANPEAQTPLTLSLAGYQQRHGGPSMAIRGREMAGSIGGRPYANVTVQLSAQRGKKVRDDPRKAYEALAGWWGTLPPDVPIPLLPLTSEDWQQIGLPLLGTLVRMAAHRRRLPLFLRTHRGECERLTGAVEQCADPAALLRLWTAEVFPHSIEAFWAVIASGSTGPATLQRHLRERLGADEAAALMSNMSGLVGDLESMGPAAGLREVREGRLTRTEYLARFGHRGVNEIELAWPRPSEDPGWLDRLLAQTDNDVSVAAARGRQRAAYDAAMGRLRQRDAREARRIASKITKAARQAALREAVRSEGVRTTGVLRRFALRAGELLGIGEDVFLLTIEELLDALDGNRTPFALFDLRRETYARYRALPALPGIIVGPFDPFAWAAQADRRTDVVVAGQAVASAPSPSDDPDLVTGHPGALGRVEGSVRVLSSFADADQLRAGEILVTPLTNIGWTPLFPRAAGIVTDLGAPLSHAAIVARELGIPAVVGCGDATTRLRTGDRVLLDGAAGQVRVLGRATSGG